MPSVEARLEELKISLPELAAPAANYVPYTVSNNQVFISGQLPKWNGELQFTGKVGREFSIDEAKQAARICGLNIIFHLKNACNGNLNRVKSCLKLNVYVNSSDNFSEQPQVANGVSDLMIEIFGDAGKHARAAVSVPSLPSNSVVEVDAIFEIN
ncbi:MAG: RidA family protein [Candidatus Caenarcaniphilales bacterium]|nr:RidA family protein [Candidatus Caenarcaniphilales bacterium]